MCNAVCAHIPTDLQLVCIYVGRSQSMGMDAIDDGLPTPVCLPDQLFSRSSRSTFPNILPYLARCQGTSVCVRARSSETELSLTRQVCGGDVLVYLFFFGLVGSR